MYRKIYIPNSNKTILNKVFIYSLFFSVFNFLLIAQANAEQSYAVFTLTSDFKELTQSKVRMIYRGKKKSLQGKKIELSDWPQGNDIRNNFYQVLLGKDYSQMNAYWAGLSFSGKARPPKEIDKDSIESLLKWLSEKRFRIGYAPVNLIPKSAHILYIVSKEKK